MTTPLQQALMAAQLREQHAHDIARAGYDPTQDAARAQEQAFEAQRQRLAASHRAAAMAAGAPPGGMPVAKSAAWIAADNARAHANAIVAQRLKARGVAHSPNISFNAPAKSAAWIANDRRRAMMSHAAPSYSVAPVTHPDGSVTH